MDKKNNIEFTSARTRDEAIDLAKKKDPISFPLATSIVDPWFRCQALSAVIKNFDGEIQSKSLSLAADSISLLSNDPYKEVAVSSWLISALIFCGKVEDAKNLFFDKLNKSNFINHGGSRAQALTLLFQSIFYVDENLRLESAIKIINLLAPPTHWRQKRTIKDIIAFLNYENPELINFVINQITELEAKKLIEITILKNKKLKPRIF